VLVENIEKSVREAPEEEERGDQREGKDESLSSKEATLNGGRVHGNTAATHD